RPGIHHVFSRTVKDLFCRHRHMRGFFVRRKAGWDTHGLPVEIEVEKQLGISGKQQIEALGVAEFNRRCRESVFTYRADWEQLSERIAYWLDYGDPYVTYENGYVESVWWALKTLYDRGRLYRGHKILPYCARCGTALSSHEVAQGYEDVEDPSVYVALELQGDAGSEVPEAGASNPATPAGGPSPVTGHPSPVAGSAPRSRRRLLVWTTTPWTLVSNVALAVHPDLAYVELRKKSGAEWTVILAEARAAAVLGEDFEGRWDVVARMKGAELVGRRYARPLDWVPFPAGAGRHEEIVAGEFVSADDGSGIVHMAPAFGADDYAAGQQHGLVFLQPVNARGRFDEALPVVGGMWVKDADPLIIEELGRRDVLWKSGTLTHAYPHCWRCGTPLLYFARDSWFVRTTAYKDEMLVRNARVDWHPPEMRDGRFGEWLKNNIDWAISRDRYWGTPLPVWVCDVDDAHVEAVGSYAELAERTGRSLPDDFDPHKPHVDAYTWPCRRCDGVMRRVPEVIDAWFDSGSMPFAQWHYPFEHGQLMASQYPADFIAEGLDQTRGWFYSLLAIAAGLGDALPNNVVAAGDDGPAASEGTRHPAPAIGNQQPARSPSSRSTSAPYRAVVVNDLVLDANGVKMSKSRGNVVNPWDAVQRHGADAVRLFLIASSRLDVPRRFDESAIRETSARDLVTLKNVYSGMFAQYANFGWAPSDRDPRPAERPLIDRWILSRLATVERETDRLLGEYDATAAARLVLGFVVSDVSNWYVRRNRDRFFAVDGEDNRAAFATLHEVLTVSSRLLAPFAPFLSDFIHRELTGASVHLAPYVRADAPAPDPALEAAMDEVRELARLGRAAREDAGIKVRQPLARLLCVVPAVHVDRMRPLLPLLAAELNVKEATLVTSADELVELAAKPNWKALGRRFGKATALAARAVEALASDDLRAFERGAPVAITVESRSHVLQAEDLTLLRRAAGALVVKEALGRFVALDPTVTPALRREGLARELVSRVQRMRRDAGLAVSDRIRLWVAGPPEIESAAREHQDWIAAEVLARHVVIGESPVGVEYAAPSVEIEGLAATVALTPDH
ncbi:MAG TPA: class I tRNA ligase family protein, partial [Gemmatimonadaceae bacterium]|nr:class I tRNA ligase family protein [Gemmatimonadaceae bacterium]